MDEISNSEEELRTLERELIGTKRDRQQILRTRKSLYDLLGRCQIAAADAASKLKSQKDALNNLQVGFLVAFLKHIGCHY